MYRQRFPDDPGMHQPTTYGPTRVTYRDNPGFLSRVKDSLFGIIVGLVLIIGATCLLFWNEGRAVQTAKSLDEGLKSVVPLENIDVVFDNNNHKLVHLTGPLQTSKPLKDPTYNVEVYAAKLRRSVEMYQWIEHEHKREINEGDRTRTETTYSYTTAWRSDVVNSNSFNLPMNHHNPPDFEVKPVHYQSNLVRVGGFSLSPKLASDISNWKEISLPTPTDPNTKIHQNMYYHGENPSSPQVGDLRVKFEFAGASGSPPGEADVVSIIAQQSGAVLQAYQTHAGDMIELLYSGTYSATKMFGNEQAQNTMVTWGVRLGGWLLMFIAFQCLTSLITTLVDWIPLVRDIVNLGVMLMNASLAISLSLCVVAAGWVYYRPLLGAALLVAAATPFVLSWWKTRRDAAESERRRGYRPTTYSSVYD